MSIILRSHDLRADGIDTPSLLNTSSKRHKHDHLRTNAISSLFELHCRTKPAELEGIAVVAAVTTRELQVRQTHCILLLSPLPVPVAPPL